MHCIVLTGIKGKWKMTRKSVCVNEQESGCVFCVVRDSCLMSECELLIACLDPCRAFLLDVLVFEMIPNKMCILAIGCLSIGNRA
mmetsp:Transcript_29294/g.52982  ORF Transcript_29294/g.52982 Transcript_29294/m.52982 type:complete len:85 (+) Transcript_29294:117-371(+)